MPYFVFEHMLCNKYACKRQHIIISCCKVTCVWCFAVSAENQGLHVCEGKLAPSCCTAGRLWQTLEAQACFLTCCCSCYPVVMDSSFFTTAVSAVSGTAANLLCVPVVWYFLSALGPCNIVVCEWAFHLERVIACQACACARTDMQCLMVCSNTQ